MMTVEILKYDDCRMKEIEAIIDFKIWWLSKNEGRDKRSSKGCNALLKRICAQLCFKYYFCIILRVRANHRWKRTRRFSNEYLCLSFEWVLMSVFRTSTYVCLSNEYLCFSFEWVLMFFFRMSTYVCISNVYLCMSDNIFLHLEISFVFRYVIFVVQTPCM